jgi:hypothetical protein
MSETVFFWTVPPAVNVHAVLVTAQFVLPIVPIEVVLSAEVFVR